MNENRNSQTRGGGGRAGHATAGTLMSQVAQKFSDNCPSFDYVGSLVLKELGLSDFDGSGLRKKLKRGIDWEKKTGVVMLSESGLRRIRRILKIWPGNNFDSCKKNGAEQVADQPILLGSVEQPIPRTFKVAAIPLNPRMVIALDEHDERQLVDVGSNANFVVGDAIETAPHENQAGIWRLLSPMPRQRRRV